MRLKARSRVPDHARSAAALNVRAVALMPGRVHREVVKLTAVWAGLRHDFAVRLDRVDEPEGYFPAWDPSLPKGTSGYRAQRPHWRRFQPGGPNDNAASV